MFKIVNTKPKRLFSLLLALMLIIGILPVNVFASELTANSEGVYLINSSEDLVSFADYVNSGNYNADAVLTADVSFSGGTAIGTVDLKRDDWNRPYTVNSFIGYSGVFDGNGHTITMPGNTFLFDAVDGGTVKNLSLTEGNKAIVQYMASGSVLYCKNYSKIDGWAYVGSIADIVGGISKSSSTDKESVIMGCFNYGNIKSSWNTGGIVGSANGKNITIDSCANFGNIDMSTGRYLGGIVSDLLGGAKVTNCFDQSNRTRVYNNEGNNGIAYVCSSDSSISNCFHVNGYEQTGAKKVSGLTEEVLAALNNSSGSGIGTLAQIKLSKTEFEYDGQEHKPIVTVTISDAVSVTEGADYIIEWPEDCINVGEKEITVRFLENNVKYIVKYAIVKSDNVWTSEPAINGWTYGDMPSQPSAAAKCGVVQFSYYDTEKNLLNERPVNAGDYFMKAAVTENESYTGIVSDYVGFTIAPKDITVTIEPKTSVYGDDIAELTATDSGTVNGDTDVYSLATAASKTASAGKYDITGTVLDSNYSITFIGGLDAYEITPRELSVDVKVANKKYDGTKNATIVSAALENIANDDEIGLAGGIPSFTSADKGEDIAIAFTDFVLSGEEAVLNNYTLKQPTGVKANITNDWEPVAEVEYTTTAADGNGWLNTDFIVTAKDGYKLSRTNTADGIWTDTLTEAAETADSALTFYIRNIETGEISLAATEHYKTDKTKPSGTVCIDNTSVWDKFLEIITFGLYYKNEQKVTVNAEDALSGIAKIEYFESSKALTYEKVSALASDKWTQMTDSITVSLEDAKQFVIYIRLTDNAGNVSYLSTDGAEYDITAPVIEGVIHEAIYYTSKNITVMDKNLASVTINGENAEDISNIILNGGKDVVYQIIATDKAGNTTTVTVTMKNAADIAKSIESITTDNVKISDKEEIEKIKKEFEKIDLTDAAPEDKAEIEKQIDICEELLKKIDELIESESATDKTAAEEITEKETITEEASAVETAADNSNPSKTSPYTGNNICMLQWFALLLIGGFCIACTAVYRQKKKFNN